MRRLLVSFVMLGAVSLSFADSWGPNPTTYTVVGAAVAEAWLTVSPTVIDQFISCMQRNCGSSSGSTMRPTMPVSWVTESGTYTGSLIHPSNFGDGYLAAWFNTVRNYWYEQECLTLLQADCGMFGQEPPRYGQFPGLDAFHLRSGIPTAVVEFEPPDMPTTPCVGRFDGPWREVLFPFGDSETSLLYVGGSMTPAKYEGRAYYDCGILPGEPVLRYEMKYTNHNMVVSVFAQNRTSVNDALNAFGTHFENVWFPSSTEKSLQQQALGSWVEGTRVQVGEPVVPLPGIRDEFRRMGAEVYAELERRAGQQMLIAPGAWNPVPTFEQWQQVVPPGGDPGGGDPGGGDPGGGGGEVDPGDCTDGWFLTRVVCEIRTFVENTWEFLSHDAWVPAEDWPGRWEATVDAAQGRFPFAVASWLDYWLGTGQWQDETYYSDAPVNPCPDVVVRVPNPIAQVNGTAAADVEGSYNFCDNRYAEWFHENGRAILYYFSLFLMSWAVFRTVVNNA